MIVIIRVRGGFKIKTEFKKTFNVMRLNKKHHCILLPENEVNKGMIKKINNWVTWGEINEETLKELIIKRGRLAGNKRVELKEKELNTLVNGIMTGKKNLIDAKINPVFRLGPPKKGWERGTIKLLYPRGAIGYRGQEVNELLKRMM